MIKADYLSCQGGAGAAALEVEGKVDTHTRSFLSSQYGVMFTRGAHCRSLPLNLFTPTAP